MYMYIKSFVVHFKYVIILLVNYTLIKLGVGVVGKNDEELRSIFKKKGTSLVAQWLRIRLPMQGTQV